MDPISVELQSQNQSVAGTKLQGSSDSRMDLTIDKEDSFSTVPVSVIPTGTISTHTNDVLGTLLEEWKSAKERMLLVKDRVAKVKEKLFVLLTLSVEDELKKLSQALDNLKRFDRLFNEIEENVSKQSIDDMLDALSVGTRAIQQSRQRFKQFVWLGSFGDQLVKCLARVCLVSLIAYIVLCFLISGGLVVIFSVVFIVGFFVWVLKSTKPKNPPRLLETEAKELLETMRLLEASFVSISALLRCLFIKS